MNSFDKDPDISQLQIDNSDAPNDLSPLQKERRLKAYYNYGKQQISGVYNPKKVGLVILGVFLLLFILLILKMIYNYIYILTHYDPNNYLVAISVIRNKRKYMREWLEFHLMMGVSHFYIYDNYSEDGLKELLSTYIVNGKVSYILWPPLIIEPDKSGENMRICYKVNTTDHIPCQKAAYHDALGRARNNNARWLADIDIDEFFYIPDDSPFWRASKAPPLVAAFNSMEDYNKIVVYGQTFGTSGWISPPRRDDDQIYAQLMTKTHPYHQTYKGKLINALPHSKNFTNPFDNDLNLKPEKSLYYNTNNSILMNHYIWPSKMEKHTHNTNNAFYDEVDDRIINKEKDSQIEYLLKRLESRIEESYRANPPLDRHADDWDFTLNSKKNKDIASIDLCVILSSPRHVGLARQALSSIINYFYRIEPLTQYKLFVNDIEDSNIKQELESDFPVDAITDFFTMEATSIQNLCSAEYILVLKEDSFARWEEWPEDVQIFKMASHVFNSNSEVHAIYLSDSSNLLSNWNKTAITSSSSLEHVIRYRSNSDLINTKGSYIMRKRVLSVNNTFEICLYTDDISCNTNQIKSLFQHYYQDRIYHFIKSK
jgi:hypothetical protein